MSITNESPRVAPPPLPPPLPVRDEQGRPSTEWIASPPPTQFANAPVPVIPLAYAQPRPRQRTRPTALVVVGIVSILIGLVSGLSNSLSMWYIAKNYSASVPPPPPTELPPIPAANITPHDGDFVRADGLKLADRQRVMDALATQVTLPPDRAILLDRFLTDVGQLAFGRAPYTSAGDVARGINKITRRGDGPDGGGGDYATHCIATSYGTILLDNATATFQPAGGRKSPVTLSGTTLTDERGMRWSAAAINEWIERVERQQRGGLLMTAQQAAVLVAHVATVPAVAPSRRDSDFLFQRIPDDLLGIHTVGNAGILAGRLGQGAYILPDGRTATDAQAPYGFGPAPAYHPLAQRRGTTFTPALPGSLNAIRATLVVQVIAVILAMLVIVAGIRTLAEWRGAAGMHMAWAATKITASLIAMAVGLWWAVSMPANRTGVPVWIGQTVGMVVVSMIYPGIVLCVFNSRAVREHYRTLGQPMWLFSPQRHAAWQLEAAEILSSSFGRLVLWTCVLGGVLTALGHLFAGVYTLLGVGGTSGTLMVHACALSMGAVIAGLGVMVASRARKHCAAPTTVLQGEMA